MCTAVGIAPAGNRNESNSQDTKMNRQDFADCFRQMCKQYNIKQKDLAECLGLSCAAISQFMSGVSLPSQDQMDKMLLKMSVSPRDAGTMRFRLMIARSEKIKKEIPENNSIWPIPQDYVPIGVPNSPDILFGDPGSLPAIPVIHLEDLNTYSPNEALHSFAKRNMRRIIRRDVGSFGTVVAVETSGSDIDIACSGVINLLLMENMPDNCSSLELCKFPDNTYSIAASDQSPRWQSFTSIQPQNSTPEWKLPVLEMSITPLLRKNDTD